MRRILAALGLGALVVSRLEDAEAWRSIGTVVDKITGAKVGVEAFDNDSPPGFFDSELSVCGDVLSVAKVSGKFVGPADLCVSNGGKSRFRMVANGGVGEGFINCLVNGKDGVGGINPSCTDQSKKNRERSIGMLWGGALAGMAVGAASSAYYFSPLPRVKESYFNDLRVTISMFTIITAACLMLLEILEQGIVVGLVWRDNKPDEMMLAFMTSCTIYAVGRVFQYGLSVSRKACHGRRPINIDQMVQEAIIAALLKMREAEILRINGFRRVEDGQSFQDRSLVLEQKYQNLQNILAKFNRNDVLKYELNKFHADVEKFSSAHECPISLFIMNDPVTPSDSGQTYDRVSYETHQRCRHELNRSQEDPLSATGLATTTLLMSIAGLPQPLATNVDRKKMISDGLALFEERLRPLEAQIQALVPAQAMSSEACSGAGASTGFSAALVSEVEEVGLRNRC